MRQICILLILLIALSCKQKEKQLIEIIKVDPSVTDSTGLSEIASGIEKIILETKESCLITRIQEIEKTNEYIFINDAGIRVLQFDTSGKFIKQIGRNGRGPGEYLSIFSIALDSINNTIYVASIRKIMCFDFSGKFLNEIKQGSFSEFITIVNNKIWTVSTSVGNKIENNSYINITKLIRYTLQGNPYDTIIVKKVTLPSFSGTIFQQAYYISDLGSVQYLYFPVLMAEPIMRDTLYEVKESNMIPSLKLDFGKAGEPQNGKKPVLIHNIYKTFNYLFAEYSFIGKKNTYCYDCVRNSTFNVSEGFIDDYYGTGIIQLRPLELKNETMYFVKEAFYLTDKIKGVTENSNPVIFIVKLKDN